MVYVACTCVWCMKSLSHCPFLYFHFVPPGLRCQSSSRWWLTTSSEGISWQPGNRSNPQSDQFVSPELQPLSLLSSIISDPPLRLRLPFCREHELQSHISRFPHFASPAEVNWMLLCGDMQTALLPWLLWSGNLWERLTQSDSNGLKSLESHHRRNQRNSSCTTCFISIPTFKEQNISICMYICIYCIYIHIRKGKNNKKLVEKVQLDVGREEARGWRGLFRTKQNISQNV